MQVSELFKNKMPSLAPMAGVSDRAYRLLCKKFGASFLVSEMVSAKGVCYQNTKTEQLCTITEEERPMGIQIFGSEPEFMAKGAEKLLKFKPDFFDINMGCPVPKVVKTGAGSALMKNPENAFEIVKAVKSAVDVPVSVKMRIGWDSDSINAVDFAKVLEDAGADFITVHGRTREQFYSGKADRKVIADVKKAVSVPVIGNGDIDSAKSCIDMYEKTNCDSVMIGRASYGNPWIFKEISAYFNNEKYTPPTIEEKMQVMLEHIRLILNFSEKSEELAIKEARKNAAWYVAGLKNAAALRKECFSLSSYSHAEELAEKIIRTYE